MALAAVLLGSALLCQQVQAIPITGSVDMSGTATLDNPLLGSATQATAFTGVTVGGTPTGSYVGTAGSIVTWNAFGWTPPSTPVGSLWSFVSGGLTYSFHLSTVSVAGQSDSFLNLLGTGTLSISGGSYTDTQGTGVSRSAIPLRAHMPTFSSHSRIRRRLPFPMAV